MRVLHLTGTQRDCGGTLIQAAEAVGEDFVYDGDGEEQDERDGEHDEDREQ